MNKINQPTTHVSIEFSPPRHLRGRSDTEDGAGMWQILLQRILYPSDAERSTFFPIWEDKIFGLCCALAVLVDPLFLYIPVIDEEFACYRWQEQLIWPFICLHSAIDLFYAMDIFVFWQRLRRRRDGNRTVKARIFQWLPIIPRIYVSLPIAQATVLIGNFATLAYFDYYIFLVFFYPLQYTLRTYGTFGLIKQRPNIETGIGRWLQAILDFLPFIIASHLFGALWYFFAVNRELDCWVKAGKDVVHLEGCTIESFSMYCDDDPITFLGPDANCYNMWHSLFKEWSTLLKASCPINPENTTKFDFGIYQYALQSDFTRSTNLPKKFLQSFWWGLRNLSSFGSNLNTSFYVLEVCFSILVSVSGLALFLVYLNARIQVSRKRCDHIKLRQRMQRVNIDIDLWLSRNDLSEQKKEIKKLIMKNVQQKVEKNKNVDVHDFFSVLPVVKKRQIMSLPRLAALKKASVPMFKSMNIRVLNEIAKHLELVSITKNCYIIREGEPIWNVLFITHGTAVSYKTCNQTLVGGSSSFKCLGKNDFIGNELLDWAFVFASLSVLPVSPTTVMSQTRVEAFSISANNLRRVVSKFRLHFSLNLPDREHSPLEHKAALSLHAAWRATANRSRGWSRLRKLLQCSEV